MSRSRSRDNDIDDRRINEKGRRITGPSSIFKYFLTYLGFVSRSDSNLLISVQTDVLAAFDDYCTDAKSSSHAGTNGSTYGSTHNGPDYKARSCGSADFCHV